VVEDADADEFADFPEAASDLKVLLAWGRVAAGVVVDVLLPDPLCVR
jgi:hypothetical protein